MRNPDPFDRHTSVKLSTANDRALPAAQRFARRYSPDGPDASIVLHNKKKRLGDVLQELADLGSTPLAADIDRIIGNQSWTLAECSLCEASDLDAVIGVDTHSTALEQMRGHGNSISVCLPCAANLVSKLAPILSGDQTDL